MSNYKLLFKPTNTLLRDCQRFIVPFGYIDKVQENSDKEFTVLLKDDRVFKFTYLENYNTFGHLIERVKEYSLHSNFDTLFVNTWQS